MTKRSAPDIVRTMERVPYRAVFFSDAIHNRNGVGTYYGDLVEHLHDRMERVELIGPTLDGTGPNFTSRMRMKMPGDSTQQLHLPSIHRVTEAVRDVAPHVIVLATPGAFGLQGLYLANRWRIPMVVGHHTDLESLSDIYWQKWWGKAATASLKTMSGFMFRRGRLVVGNSQAMLDGARALGARGVRLVGTTIARSFFEQPRVPLQGGLNSVLFAGRLAPEKNIQHIIKAAETLPGLRFKIAGDGPLRDEVADAAARLPNLEYLGWIGREKIIELLDSADMLVLPSVVESFGTIALEAMARGRLVLVSGNCGILDWPDLAKGIYSIADGETLTDALERIAAEPDEAHLAKAQISLEAAGHLLETTLNGWIDIFRNLAEIPN